MESTKQITIASQPAMSVIVESWMKKRLGYCLKLDSPNLGNKLYDGVIFYNLLKNYNIISEGCDGIPKSGADEYTAFTNLQKMCPWFKILGISHDEEFLHSIACKDAHAALRLLFEFYIKLEDKDSVQLITQQRKSQLLKMSEGRFDTIPCQEPTIFWNEEPTQDVLLEKSLADNNELIARFKQYKLKVEQECKEESRLRRQKIAESLKKPKIEEVFKTVESKEQKDPVVEFIQKLAERNKEAEEYLKCSPKNYIDYLKQKKRKRLANEVLKVRMQNMLLHDLWSALLERQEEEFNKAFQEKLLQQSEFEKSLALRLTRIHNNYKGFFEQKREMEEKIRDQDDHLIKNEDLQKSIEEDKVEKRRIMELHRRLYEEKMKVKHEKHLEICCHIVEDMVDFAIKMSNYKYEHALPVSRWIINEWKDLFYKEIPLFPKLSQENLVISDDDKTIITTSEENQKEIQEAVCFDSQLLSDKETINSVNNFSLHSYLYLVGKWAKENWPELNNLKEKLNITGYVMHRLLEFKYPFPPLPQPAKMDHFKVKVILGPTFDEYLFKNLSIILKEQSIKIVDANSATNYCLGIYKKEATINDMKKRLANPCISDEEKARSKSRKDSRKAMQKTNPSAKLREKTRSLSKKSKTPTTKKGKGPLTKHKMHAHNIPHHTSDKAVQYPSIPEIIVEEKYSPAGLLGKAAFELLNSGKTLSDILLCKMIVEYLTSFIEYQGFVLINYPLSVTQAALLEFLITGKPVETTLKVESDVDLFMTKLFNPPMTIDIRLLMDFETELAEFVQDASSQVLCDQKTTQEEKDNEFKMEEKLQNQENIDGESHVLSVGEENKKELKNKRYSRRSSRKRKSSNYKSKGIVSAQKRPSQNSKISIPQLNDEDDEMEEEQQSEVEEVVQSTMHPISYSDLLKLRTSKILPRPNEPYDMLPNTESYFDRYIVLQTEQGTPKKKEKEHDKKGDKIDISSELSFEESKPEHFYKALGICKEFETYNSTFEMIKLLGRLILGDSDVQNQSSEELFGSAALDELNERLTTSQKALPRKKTSSVKSQQGKPVGSVRSKIKSSKSLKAPSKVLQSKSKPDHSTEEESILHGSAEDEAEEEIPAEIAPPITISNSDLTTDSHEPRPGERGWHYANEYIPEQLQIALASIWETVEHVYLKNLKAIFNLLRIHSTKLLPYRNFVRDVMEECLKEPDERSYLVTNFHIMYNDVDDEFRQDAEMKAELHCRIYELYNILCELSDKKRDHSLKRRIEIINQGWVAQYIYPLANLYTNMLQLELDRFIDSIQILNDYYMSMLQLKPEEKRLDKIILKKYREDDKDSEKKAGSSKKKRKASQESSSVMDNIVKYLMETDNNHLLLENPAHALISSAVSISQIKIKTVQNCIKGMIKEENLNLPLKISESVDRSKLKTSEKFQSPSQSTSLLNGTISSSVKSRGNKKEGLLDKELNDDDIRELGPVDRTILEWETAVDNETERMEFRLKLIELRAKDDLSEVMEIMGAVFREFYNDINFRYNKEISAIEGLCTIFRNAVEQEMPIQPTLVLEQDVLYVDKNNLTFPDIPPPPPTPTEELSAEYRFTIEQLNNFMAKMTHVAPLGVVEEAFVDILEDMATFSQELGNPFIPVGWSKLTRSDIKYVLGQAFGDSGVFDWREFIIFAMGLPYPKIEELIEVKKKYEEIDVNKMENISYEQFMNIPLWFDKDFGDTIQDDLHLVLSKELIFKLFQVNKKEMNYSAMLLAFCKGEDSIDGFLKALQILNPDFLLHEDECYLESQRMKMESQKIADQLIVQLLHDVLQKTEGIIIKTLPRHTNVEVYGSENNEYEISEEILENCKSKKLSDPDYYSSDSESDSLTQISKMQEQPIEEEPTYPERYNHPKWNVCVPYEIVISLLVVSLNFYVLSPVHLHRQLHIEERLQELYRTKGRGNYIKAFLLVESDVLKDVFQQTGVFKMCNINYLVEKLLTSKKTLLEL